MRRVGLVFVLNKDRGDQYNRKVGDACGVHHDMVGAVRKRLAESATPAEPAAPDLDRLVARLSKALVRVFEQWPPERRAELRKLLDAADREPCK